MDSHWKQPSNGALEDLEFLRKKKIIDNIKALC